MCTLHKISLMTRTDALFKAIAHPARRHILTLLADSDHSVKELTSVFEMSQTAVSQHLRELREARLVTSHRVGSEQKYTLTGAPLKTVFDWCVQYRRFFDPAGHAWSFAPAQPVSARKKKGGT